MSQSAPSIAALLLALGCGLGPLAATAMSFLPGEAAAKVTPPPASRIPPAGVAERILVKKDERRLYLMRDGRPFRTYGIRLGGRPEGHKQRQGDGRTPEGRYYIDSRNPESKFRKSLKISYPSAADRLEAARRGDNPGGLIMIHGEPRPSRDADLQVLARREDWTQGCIAVSNLAIDEIWEYTRLGTPIEIRP